ncbi:hypothetical protein L210DRAFT_3644989 [Boletus edulis BED1]|uniref:Uncharacterized protein n=1 Tax=Boletus edulis BED1 TaxID=1328754 RepID=A0AAD4BWJ4_BOLED|nr:hypothetical protein L210DRAFT_3644989 [Boletus edulis BED1]
MTRKFNLRSKAFESFFMLQKLKNLFSLGEDRKFLNHAPPQAFPDVQDEIHSGRGTSAYDGAQIMTGPVFSTTSILPATVVYLAYLIVAVATGSSSLPSISTIMLGASFSTFIFDYVLQ